MSHWNHRTVKHIDSRKTTDMFEEYLSVHEVYYEDSSPERHEEPEGGGKPYLWNPHAASPRDKEEAEWIVRAFDKPPVVEVDDASWTSTEGGLVEDYKTWRWI